MDFNKYLNPLPFPNKNDYDRIEYYQKLNNFRNAEIELDLMFKKDLIEEFGLVGHPKTEILWKKSWEFGHSSGRAEVYYYFSELIDLI
jgi:hypothetical protein